MLKKNQMVLLVTDTQLLGLIRDLEGWQQLMIRFTVEQDGHQIYTVQLSQDQARVLGQAKIREIYGTEYSEVPALHSTQPIPIPAKGRA